MAFSPQEFEVSVCTSSAKFSGTFSRLWVTLIGSEGETTPVSPNNGEELLPLSVVCVQIRSHHPVGRVLLVRLRLEAREGFPDTDWLCAGVRVVVLPTNPWEEEVRQNFPCEQWLRSSDGDVLLRQAFGVLCHNLCSCFSSSVCLLQDEMEEKLKEQRFERLKRQQEVFRWRKFISGAPHCIDLNSPSELGPNFHQGSKSPTPNHLLRAFVGRVEPWMSFSQLETVFAHIAQFNCVAQTVKTHWKEDWYFGYQRLNGCNPLMVRRISVLPPNLSITSDMLRPFLTEGTSLEDELHKGTIYLLDYEVLDSVPANVINGVQTHLAAPLCLLHLNSHQQMVPIAIQLQQMPGPQNPVFLPSDPGCDWLLAKMWIQSSDFQCHQLTCHYLRTHMMAELCCVATLRTLPEVHPLHQLLMPHVKTSLTINLGARASLLAPNGVFDKAVGSGLNALPIILSRGAARISYQSLCVPDDLKARGLDRLSLCYYGQDALKIWEALHKFVAGWLDLYYGRDDDIQRDSELQNWITEINTHGFTHDSGFPQMFHTKAEVSKLVTMFIFSCSALHAALNFSQLDFALWIPNCPTAMMRPPPQVKAGITEDDILSFLPDVSSSCRVLAVLALLSQPAENYVSLCQYREAVFKQGDHVGLVTALHSELQKITADIRDRNSHLEAPYPYLRPDFIENSVAI
ncbi:polyunsaturated fatty acid lipoxygenase ALOX15B [Pholidichthys leucotaenia]